MTRNKTMVVGGVTTALVAVTGVAGAVGLTGRSPAKPAAVRPAAQRADRSLPAPDARSVPPLRRMTPPDAVISLPREVSPRRLARVRHVYGVKAVAVADAGRLYLNPHLSVRALGVDVGAIRGFTPRFTARSRPLWTSVARGEMTVDYSLAGRMKSLLGATIPVATKHASPTPLRVGAFATIGLGDAQVIVDRSLTPALHLARQRVIVVSAPKRSDSALLADLRAVAGPHARVRLVRPKHVDQMVMSAYARAMIPVAYLRLYRAAAATCRGLPWTVLAAIGTVETRNGADNRTSSKGAMGPMQFLPSTFAAYAVDGDGDGVANIQDPADAIYSAARYLCAWGAGLGGQSLYAAIFAYNHADWYVRLVLQYAVAYA
jgi:hypothetical protein